MPPFDIENVTPNRARGAVEAGVVPTGAIKRLLSGPAA